MLPKIVFFRGSICQTIKYLPCVVEVTVNLESANKLFVSTISLSKNGSTFSYGHSSSDVTSSNVKGAYMSITGAVELNGSTDYVELRLRLIMVSQTPTVYDSYFGGYKIIGA